MWFQHPDGYVRLSSIDAVSVYQESTTRWYVALLVAGSQIPLGQVNSLAAAQQQAADIVALMSASSTV